MGRQGMATAETLLRGLLTTAGITVGGDEQHDL